MRKLTLDDTFNAAELIEIFQLPEVYARLAKADRSDPTGFAIQALIVFMKQAGTDENRKKIYDFLAGPFESTSEELKAMPLLDVAKGICEIADVDDWKAFLNSVRSTK